MKRGGKPTRVGASIGDVIAGIFTAYGVMLALYNREKTGKGQLVDVAMLDCQVAILENAIARYVCTGNVPGPIGNRHPSITPFADFTAKDGSIIVGSGNDRLWAKLCNILERPELINDPKYATNPLRNENVKTLTEILNGIFATKTVAEWVKELEAAGVPCAPINNVKQIIEDPSIVARDMIVELVHPVAGALKVPGVPVKLSDTPGQVLTPAPVLNNDRNSILKEFFGWDENTVTEKLN